MALNTVGKTINIPLIANLTAHTHTMGFYGDANDGKSTLIHNGSITVGPASATDNTCWPYGGDYTFEPGHGWVSRDPYYEKKLPKLTEDRIARALEERNKIIRERIAAAEALTALDKKEAQDKYDKFVEERKKQRESKVAMRNVYEILVVDKKLEKIYGPYRLVAGTEEAAKISVFKNQGADLVKDADEYQIHCKLVMGFPKPSEDEKK